MAKRDDVNQKTVAKWKQRSHVHDAPLGPTPCHSTVLTLEEEALVVALRRHTRRPLDDGLYARQPTWPHLTRAALHRWLPRHGIRRVPDIASEKSGKKPLKASPLGYVPIDIAEVRTEEGTLSLCVAIDRSCQCAYAELQTEANTMVAAQSLRNLLAALPDKIHTVLTEHGIPCTNRKRDLSALHQLVDCVCQEAGIDPRLTNTNQPWTNGQGERMNRTRKEAIVKKYDDETYDHLKAPLHAFLMAYTFAKRLTTLLGSLCEEGTIYLMLLMVL